jgi:EmrB/QacA subfamily drug resistance transporter
MPRRPTGFGHDVPPSSRAAVGLRSERGPVLLALMVSTGLVAIDSTILATAVPSIVRDVGGYAQFPWLFSVYLLAQAVSVSVYAKLADTFGRKPIILFGIGLFLAGSVLCGFAWSMTALIVFRALQGLGAGAVQPMSMTIAGDIYTVAERATAQGYIAAVWAMSSVVGPTLGGILSQLGVWRWIFFVNVPLCLVAGTLIIRNFRETVRRSEHRIDVLGAVLLTAGTTLLILGVLEGGQAWAWGSPAGIGVPVAGALLLAGFVLAERRAAEPVLPLWVFNRRLLATTTLLALGVGVLLIGLTSYVPTYLENALGVPPLVAGLALAALTLGWPISATLSGRLFYLRFGFRPTVLIGLALVVLGTAALAVTAHAPSVWVVAGCSFVTGLGMGLVAAPSLIAAQASVEWHERGVATGANMFARSIGSAVGAAVLGAVANGVVAASGHPATDPQVATDAGAAVFAGVLVAAVLTVVAGLLMPRVDAAVAPTAPPQEARQAEDERAPQGVQPAP